jgi:glycosyltransferase involved in cell wall biosynthesis
LQQPNPNEPTLFNEYLLVVGRVEARKNPITAIKAFALIASQYPKLQLVFAGGFGYQADLAKQLAQTVGLSDRIHFLGFVDDAKLANLYFHAKIVLFPSLYEGFGLPVLEAFHYGVPAVASNTPAVAEVAGDGAMLVDPTDALNLSRKVVQLLEEPELRAQLIERGTHRLQQYSWDQSAEKLLALINSL